ncbi:MAG: TCP-1/cpn60 chaperonin family protein, partial [Pirellulaceae bacterium]|nr:TCP-1/cpn60 chaperonin family protein [Pirellulaceae bacterium]
MPPKDVVFSEEARGKLRKGVETIASVVGSTLGPKGRNVMIAKYSTPDVSNDGQTIAKQFESLEDIHEDVGMRILKEAAVKTGDKVGDGTTSSVVLAQAIVHAALKSVAAGANPMFLKRGADLAVAAAVKKMRDIS